MNGSARVGLVAEGATTRVDYAVTAQVGGKLAQIGSRLIDAAATKVSNDFFARFAEAVLGQLAIHSIRRAAARLYRRRAR